MKLFIDRVKSPIGEIRIVSDGENLRALDFEDYEERMEKLLKRHYGTYELVPMKNPNRASFMPGRTRMDGRTLMDVPYIITELKTAPPLFTSKSLRALLR